MEDGVRRIKLKMPERVDAMSVIYTGSNTRIQRLFKAWHRDGKARDIDVTDEEMREFFGNIRVSGTPVFPGSLAAQAMEEATRPPSDEEKADEGE